MCSICFCVGDEVRENIGQGDSRVDEEDGVMMEGCSPEGELKALYFAHVVVNSGGA